METPPEYHQSFRGRANTLERTEQIRPPRRKRRGQDSAGTGTGNNRRAGSVPPELQPSSSFSGRSVDHETTPTTGIVVNPGTGLTGLTGCTSTINHLLPVHFPRVRRASRQQQKQSYGSGSAGSAPSSGTNTPDTIHGSSAVDLYDLTPFGSTGSGVDVGNKSNTLRAARHKNRTSAPGSTKWNWIWNRTSSSGGSGKNSPDLKPDIKQHGSSGGSFLGRKRKSRHISCPDISSASDSASDMSRSSSPVGFKVSLSSLFGGHRGHGTVVEVAAGAGAAAASASGSSRSSQHGSSSSTARRPLGLSKAEKIASSQKAHLTYAKPVMSQVDDFTSEIIDELCSVQYCHISDPLRGLSVETLNPQEIETRYIQIYI